ncbi:hypothetical protein PsorP6_016610 [Peronosclerospora sorghi]|uniref:Uncharacterized protein n=1 Tax=Peronosclerospora sorghi TaxID=230839 RepID=A0ACC0VQ76_9STRA|nr:hypothetical protein PsorP6_016610 [Peronosclerospora sorghi]
MDAPPVACTGTLKVRHCLIFWVKTPIQLTYYRRDYRHALPVLLLRQSKRFGGELCIPLDPCLHPIRLLPVTKKMVSKFEFALEYGWLPRNFRLRAPNFTTYTRWINILRAALASGRRLPTCTSEEPRQDLECSSVGSTLHSSNNDASRINATIQRKGLQEHEDELIPPHLDPDLSPSWPYSHDLYASPGMIHHIDSHGKGEEDCDTSTAPWHPCNHYFWPTFF